MHSTVGVLLFALFSAACAAGYTYVDPTIEASGCRRNGKCECVINGTWTKYQEYLELQVVRKQVSDMGTAMEALDVPQLMEDMRNITERMKALVQRVDSESISVSMRELISLRKSADILVTLVGEVQKSGNSDKLKELKAEIIQLVDVIDDLWNRNPYGEGKAMQRELEALRNRLTNCQANLTWSAFKGDTLPLNFSYADWCDSHDLASVGSPVVHRWWSGSYPYGTWFKDPIPETDENRQEIFAREYYGSTGYKYDEYLVKYKNYSDFIANKVSANVDNEYTTGVGDILYYHSWYWSYGNNIFKQDLKLNTRQSRVVSKSNIDYLRQNSLTYVDFKVDEYGLWAIMATSDNGDKLVIFKVNPKDLTFTESFRTNRHKNTVCAVFMVCGKMYTIEACGDRLKPSMPLAQYVYDTRTKDDTFLSMPVTSKFGQISSLNYNPRERTLFGWDNGHLVTYPLAWTTKTKA